MSSRIFTRYGSWSVLLLCLVMSAVGAFAQGGGESSGTPIDVSADRIEGREDGKLAILTGNVTITMGSDIFKADYVTFNKETYEAHARGNVYITREGRVYEGDEAHYNFRTRQGDFMEFEITDDPFFMTAEETERLSDNEFILRDATITTCGEGSSEFYIKSREAYVTRGDRMHAKNVVFYYYGIPIFYAPWITKSIGSSQTNIDVIPGYSSRDGFFLLGAYNYGLNDYLRGVTHLDYRRRRGVGVGQDLYWEDPEEGRWKGDFAAYYSEDDKPYGDDRERAARSDTLKEGDDRYRFRLQHRQGITESDTARVRMNYLSDPFVLEDFFESEFRVNTVPENYATVTHRDPRFTAAINIEKRLNDFYSTVDRLPEVTFDVPSLRLGDTPFFYDSQSSAAYLKKTFPEGATQKEYESFRLDTGHTVSYPTRHMGWLNIIPRAGYQATFYDATPRFSTNIVSKVGTDTAGNTVTQDQRVVTFSDGDSELRNLFELGFETSFKGFREIHRRERNDFDVGLRHVIEPFTDYTFVPEPNLEPQEIYQFDAIDRLDERNDLLLGLRNKWQTKRNDRLHDLLDVVVSTFYYFDPQTGQEDFSDLFFDAELRWVQNFWIDVDGAWDYIDKGELRTLNFQAAYRASDGSSLAGEYRYRKDNRDQVAAELNLFPEQRVSYTGYVRYAFDLSELEEHSQFIRFKTECIGYGLGYRQLSRDGGDDEYRIWAQVWLLAFPNSVAQLGR